VIEVMPRQRPPHLVRETTRHGSPVWYVRVGHGARIRLRADYGTDDFRSEYDAAIAGDRPAGRAKYAAGTLAWLIDRYRDSAAWSGLSMATRRQRENIFAHIVKTAGAERLSRITRKVIVAGRDRRRETPNAARHFVQTMRGLFAWAVEADLVADDPTRGIKVQRPATDGHKPWLPEWCEAFEKRWPVGTRPRLAYDVLLYTGLRRGDAVRLGRPHVRDGIATIRTEKTGEIVTIPILPPLQTSIEAGPVGELTFIAGEAARPLTKESFGNMFRGWCKAAGVPGSAHGLRKAGATRAAQNGATVAQLEALFGWRGGGMASLYTREVDRARLAQVAAEKMLGQNANIYSRTSAKGAGLKPKRSKKSWT
jgi:integrase